MVSSIVKFGVRQTEAVAVGAVRFGLRVARTIVEAAIDATARGHSEDFSEPPAPPEQRLEPPEASPPEASRSEASRSEASPSEATPHDPERERRIALRDQPSENEEQSPHHVLNNPVTGDPDPTEWPDPYDQREDPRDPEADELVLPGEAPHTPTGSQSTSSPHPSQDPEAERWNRPKRSASGE